jgi:putative serine protease PepD
MSDGEDQFDQPREEEPTATPPSATPEPESPQPISQQPVDITPTADDGSGRPWWGEPWSEDSGEAASSVPQSSAPLGATQVIDGEPPATHAPRRRVNPLLVLAVVAGIVLFTGIGSAIGVAVGDNHSDKDSGISINKSGHVATAPAVDASGTTNIESVAATVLPTVVSIEERTSSLEGTGSGVILDASRGLILTNNHVVSAAVTGNGKITVTLNDGRTAAATVRGRDPSSDIAVVQVHLDNLTAATLGDSSSIKVGQTVVAFGSPLGLQGSVTSGIVSALDRPVSTEDTTNQTQSGTADQATIDAIQTDAAINPGNSGGPLVDGAGHVIGINSAIASTGDTTGTSSESGSIGVGFSIPINEALDTAEQIIKTGHAVHPVIDASISDTTDGSNGALLRVVNDGGPAQKAGLRVGDVITSIDGKSVTTPDAAIVALRKDHHPGDSVKISYLRDGKNSQATVTLGASAPSP